MGVVLHAHPVHGESHIYCNENHVVDTIQIQRKVFIKAAQYLPLKPYTTSVPARLGLWAWNMFLMILNLLAHTNSLDPYLPRGFRI